MTLGMWLAGGGLLFLPLIVLGMWLLHRHVERRDRARGRDTLT